METTRVKWRHMFWEKKTCILKYSSPPTFVNRRHVHVKISSNSITDKDFQNLPWAKKIKKDIKDLSFLQYRKLHFWHKTIDVITNHKQCPKSRPHRPSPQNTTCHVATWVSFKTMFMFYSVKLQRYYSIYWSVIFILKSDWLDFFAKLWLKFFSCN